MNECNQKVESNNEEIKKNKKISVEQCKQIEDLKVSFEFGINCYF